MDTDVGTDILDTNRFISLFEIMFFPFNKLYLKQPFSVTYVGKYNIILCYNTNCKLVQSLQ